MDRRRFTPSPESLDDRVLLSAFSLTGNTTTSAVQAKTVRIDRIGHALDTLQPGRIVPEPLVNNLKADLTAVRGKLHAPTPMPWWP